MRILLATIGTRGDVEPHLALALRLCDAGHEVAIATAIYRRLTWQALRLAMRLGSAPFMKPWRRAHDPQGRTRGANALQLAPGRPVPVLHAYSAAVCPPPADWPAKAGTTGAGLRAGRPSVICPFGVDQPYWGARVHALGAGPAPIPQRRLDVEPLAAALQRAVHDRSMRERAEALGRSIRAEDGVGAAQGWIERSVSSGLPG
jgi:hypothetical protein